MSGPRRVHEPLVNRAELAEMMSISVRTLDEMLAEGRRRGDPCPTVTWGRRLSRFRPSEALRWAEAQQNRRAA